nr:uncharacterized protein LOC124813994 [Hydra vulgaris]
MASSILPETTLPSLKVKINGMLRTALIDSGCSITVIHAKSTHGLVLKSQKLITTLGRAVHVLGETVIKFENDGIHRIVNSMVVKEKPFGFDLIFGMNAIEKFGGVIIYENKRNEIKHQDFAANFDVKKWTASWNWNKEPVIDNTICEYNMSHEYECSYRKEINEWINSGILVPYNELTLGPPKVLIPLMCVVQENKDKKVRPVGDFRALNEFVNCHTANADVCQEKLRCRRKIKMQKLLILKKPTSKFILIKDSGHIKRINVASTIMTTILRHVLNLNPTVKKVCDNYIDDIFVDESVETAENVAKHLHKFGLQCKPPQHLERERVLGLRVEKNKNGKLIWRRDNVVQFEPLNAVTRSQLFSKFEDCKEKLKYLLHRVEKEDPVGGKWLVPVNGKAELYCDASSIGHGVVLLINRVVVEDAAWLRPASDTHHINISELDSILRGKNLASRWDIKELTVYSDSKSTVGWVNAVLKEEYRVKTRGISQLLVQRRLNTIKEVEVSAVIAKCNQCNSIDTYSVQWKNGQLSVEKKWNRVAIDVTDVGAELYLSIIDCGPSRYTIWRKLITKTAAEVVGKLEEIFSLFGPPVCLLMDNEFRSNTLTSFAENGMLIWNIEQHIELKTTQETKCDQPWIPGVVQKQNTLSFDVEYANRVYPRHISPLRCRANLQSSKESVNDVFYRLKDKNDNAKGRYHDDVTQIDSQERVLQVTRSGRTN